MPLDEVGNTQIKSINQYNYNITMLCFALEDEYLGTLRILYESESILLRANIIQWLNSWENYSGLLKCVLQGTALEDHLAATSGTEHKDMHGIGCS